MKSDIKGSGLIKVSGDNTIDVCYDVPDASILAEIVGGITPVMWDNKKIDEQALADYDAFVSNVYEILYTFFDIVNIEKSNRSETSWYFWLYAKNKDDKVATKVLIRLRLSDHELPDTHDEQAENEYIGREAEKYKRPKDKLRQRWKLKNIVVNNDTYSSYDDAEDAIDEYLEELSRHFTKDPEQT